MITVDSAIHNLLKPLATQYGFKKKRNLYIRLVNDMVQVFDLKKMYGAKCSIEFSCMPLCAGHKVFWGTFDIDMFESPARQQGDLFISDDRFIYSKDDEASIYKVADTIYYLSKEYMFPLFENSADSKSFFDLWIEYETQLTKRITSDPQSVQESLEYALSLNYQLHAIALKNHDYEFAMKHINWKLDSYEKSFRRYDFDPESDKGQRTIENHRKYSALKEWVENEENAKIDALVAENENTSLQALKEKYRILM